jgi:hypothetical protein
VEAPADLDRGQDLGQEERHREADEADRPRRLPFLGEPQAEAARVPGGDL